MIQQPPHTVEPVKTNHFIPKLGGAIFDMDGTLLDTMSVWKDVGEQYLLSKGITPLPGFSEHFINLSSAQSAEYMISQYGLTISPEDVCRDINGIIEAFYFHQAQTKPGVVAFLQRLHAKNIPMCVATATDLHLAKAALKRTGLLPLLQDVLTCTQIGHGKDEPDIFEAALACLGTAKQQTYVFEDALYALKTAKKAGFPVVGVYDPSERAAEEVRSLSNVYVHSMEELEIQF